MFPGAHQLSHEVKRCSTVTVANDGITSEHAYICLSTMFQSWHLTDGSAIYQKSFIYSTKQCTVFYGNRKAYTQNYVYKGRFFIMYSMY